VREQLTRVQHVLFRVGAVLATPAGGTAKREVDETHVVELEQWIEALESALPPQRGFILPGGTRLSSMLHVGRTACRRAERWVVSIRRDDESVSHSLVYLNRLSDYLFLLARRANRDASRGDVDVQY